MDRKELEAKAKALGINFDDDTSDEELKSLIDDAESKNSDPEYLKSEMQNAIKSRDRAKADKRALKEELDRTKEEIKNLKDQMKGLADGDTLDELKEQLEELKEYKKEQEEAKRKADEDKMSAEERHEARIKRLEEQADKREQKAISDTSKEFQAKLDEALGKISGQEKTISSLRGSKLEGDIIKASNKYGAIKPSDIYRMVKDDFEFDVDEGRFYHYTRDKNGAIKDEKDVDEYVKDFLSNDDNDYLVKADVRGNSFHSQNNDNPQNRKTTTTTTGKYDPKDKLILKQAEEVGLSVEDYIKTQEMRDAKMEKVNANRK